MNITPLINEITNCFNESLRAPRFNIEKKNAAITSRILSDVTLSGSIKEYQPNYESRRYKSYLPY